MLIFYDYPQSVFIWENLIFDYFEVFIFKNFFEILPKQYFFGFDARFDQDH